ncbi:hypothetical protein IC235_05525 [Hymenobacter sp. BT664]|uniref:Uncharacterized protein n=1 Tax=Hymenobacter montanus TaxID=2771359 RepID=A0A927GID9_9BACT|nr:hypothetical protein [Hymenobacter montanus]MBD2767348.1 hypothetical protein [Hymenobacter montanus]
MKDVEASSNFAYMKKIALPETIVGLPHPWCVSSAIERHKQIEALNHSLDEVETVLNVLERCLQAQSKLTLPTGDSIPESLTEYWNFTTEWFAEKMPKVDDFDLTIIEEILKGEEIESPSEQMIEKVAELWLWSVAQDIANIALIWLEDALRKPKNTFLVSHLIAIASRYWQQVDSRLAQSLLSRSAMIGRQEALPLLNSVESNTSVASAIRQTAQDYREFILDSNNKN